MLDEAHLMLEIEVDNAALRYEQSLREAPSASMERFRSAWNTHAATSSSIPEDHELIAMIIGLGRAYRARSASVRGPALDEDVSEEIWRASLHNALPLLLLEFIIHDEFFHQPKEWIMGSINILLSFVTIWALDTIGVSHQTKASLPSSLISRFLSTMPRFWDSLWARRGHIFATDVHNRDQLLQYMENLAGMINRAFRENSQQLDRLHSTKITQTVLWLWKSQSLPSLLHVSTCSALYVLSSGFGPKPDDHMPSQSQTSRNPERLVTILKHEELGIEPILHKTFLAIRDSTVLTGTSLFETLTTANMYVHLLDIDVTDVWWNQPVVPAIVAALARERFTDNSRGSALFRVANWTSCVNVIETVQGAYGSQVRTRPPGYSGPSFSLPDCHGRDVFFVLQWGVVDWMNFLATPPQPDWTQHLPEYERIAITGLCTWTSRLREFCAGQGLGAAFPPNMLDNLRIALEEMWYTTVQTIREYERKAQVSGVDLGSIQRMALFRDAWLGLGAACDLDEIAIRNRTNKTNTRRCAWAACKFNSAPSSKPLRACTGCQSVRYCSTECQMADWKDGGHRVQCRRLKCAK